MKEGSSKVKLRFLQTTHYSTVGAMKKGQVVEVDPDEATRILEKFGNDVEVVKPRKQRSAPKTKAK